MKKYFVILSLIFVCQYPCCKSYNILAVFPIPSVSHSRTPNFIMEGLAEKGHDVTVVSHFKSDRNISTYKSIILERPSSFLVNGIEMANINAWTKYDNIFGTPTRMMNYGKLVCEQLKSQVFRDLLKSREIYDILILEFFNNDCMAPLADRFRVPIIGYTPGCPLPWVTNAIGLPQDALYSPNPLLSYSNTMTFIERVENIVVSSWQVVFYEIFFRHSDSVYVSKYYKNIEPANTIRKWTSAVISNCHFTLNWPRSSMPHLIDVAGIVPDKKTLPKDLEKWISESKDGVIYFSMGSLLKGHTLPKEKKDAFLKAFAKLPQRVLWKWENDTMEDKPDNVMIQKWMPQFDILSHPNVKAFVSHGGLLGITEAVHCGVPMVIMPQFGDQHTNAKAIESKGGGVILPLSQVTEESVYKALKTVLSSSFREQAKQLSEIFRDRPLPPLETAIYWIEYVARHKGAPHMRTAAVDMPFYQYYLLDVFAFLILVVSTFIYVTYLLCRTIIRWIRRSSIKEKTS